TQQGKTVRGPLWIMPGQPDGVVTVHLGYGRPGPGAYSSKAGDVVGFDAYQIRTSFEPWYTDGVRVANSGTDHQLATTQLHFTLEDPQFSTEKRDVVRTETLEEFLHGQKHEEEHEHPTLYPEYPYRNQDENTPDYAWGMAIDLNNCIGCNACTIAC